MHQDKNHLDPKHNGRKGPWLNYMEHGKEKEDVPVFVSNLIHEFLCRVGNWIFLFDHRKHMSNYCKYDINDEENDG